jgi:hypothetical protein
MEKDEVIQAPKMEDEKKTDDLGHLIILEPGRSILRDRVERLERAVLGLAMLNGEFQTIVTQPEYDKLRRSLRSDLLALLDQMRGEEGE